MFTAVEAREAGVCSALLSYYVNIGLLTRIARGIYRNPNSQVPMDFQWEDLILTAKSIPTGVICLISALALYELTEEIPRAHWIAVPNSTTAPKREGTKIIRMRDVKTGVTRLTIGNESVQIFDRERTIVDAFKNLSKETAIKALKKALKQNEKIDIKKMRTYAKKLRVNIDPYIIAVSI